jgi:hypothetical protein
MATEQNQAIAITRTADASLAALQYTFVKIGTSGGCAAQVGQGLDCLGVLQNAPGSGKPAIIVIAGVTKLRMGGVVADGGAITTGTAGRGEAVASGDYTLGKSLHGAASVSGDIITASVNCVSNFLAP